MFFKQFTADLKQTPKFSIKKKIISGKTIIWKQDKSMRILQERFLDFLESSCNFNFIYATGGIKKKSTRSNAASHRNNRYFFVTDIKSFYPSIDPAKLAELLCEKIKVINLDYKQTLAFLKKYCFTPVKGLRLGSTSSPWLANFYAHFLIDMELGRISKKYGLTYTRFFDDLIFSRRKAKILPRAIKEIRQTIEAVGLKINDRKTKIYDLKKGEIVLTKIGINKYGRFFVPKKVRKKIRAIIFKGIMGEVSKFKVYGYMGIIKHIIALNSGPSNSEQKLLDYFQKFQEQINFNGIK